MPLSLRFALRELRGGMTGLRLLAVCLFLGVAALAGVGSLSASILDGLSRQGRELLGGDVEVRLTQRPATPAERAAFARAGLVSETVRMSAMAGPAGGEDRMLVELKAVDRAYPLYGRFRLEGGGALRVALDDRSAVLAPALAERLGLGVGDMIEVGDARLRIAGVIAEEPDRAGEGISFSGPVLLVSLETLRATGLVQPGSLLRYLYRLKLPANASAEAVATSLERDFPDAGWQVRDRSNAAPGVRRFVERLGQFLTLVGLTALIVAGVGVGNGVASYLDAKSVTIATFKSLGATSGLIFRSYLWQIGLVSLTAVTAGAAFGALVPWIVPALAGDAWPALPNPGIHPLPLFAGCAYGLLSAVAFALWPLSRARRLPAARLFRAGVETDRWPSPVTIVAILAAAALIVTLAILQARERMLAAMFIAAAFGLLVILLALAIAVRHVAARLPRPRDPLARLALSNLHRPRAMTRQLIVALGLGLTLFATLSVIETNLSGQIEEAVPARAPTYVFIDIPSGEVVAFRNLIARAAPDAELRTVPSLRGPITQVNGVPAAQVKATTDNWALHGDRGLTYSATLPPGSRVVEGKWWPADYAGPPLMSIDVEMARALGLDVGDTLTVSVLGVDVTATIASFREIEWNTMSFNFVMVFAPGTLEAAPHSYMATASVDPSRERPLFRAVTKAYPAVSVIRVKDALDAIGDMFDQLSTAVRAAASVTIAAGIAVLVGALAASRRARIYDSVLLKVLGASRGQVLRALLIEYGLLAAIVALLALLLGAGGGWYIVTHVFELDWRPDWGAAILTVAAGAAVTVILGLAGSWSALSARPNRVLRAL